MSQSTPQQHWSAENHAYPLLPSKLSTPRLPATLVTREHLLRQVDQALTHELTLISASAGFGKTTLLSSWVARCPSPVAWLSLEKQDNDPTRFWNYVFAALRTAGTTCGETALSMLQGTQPLAMQIILTTLITEATALPDNLVLILDDFHVIEEPGIHDALRFLLEHLPSTLHLVFASRVNPPLPLSRLRVRGQLVEIRDTDLRFTQEEAALFLKQSMGLTLSTQDVALLEARTEGWIASLQLAALSLQKHDNPSAFIQTLSGSSRLLLDYVQEEILDRQPPSLQDFLLQTSELSRLSAALCNAVTGRSDSDLLLQQIERANLFLQPLDDEQQWYGYHALWASAIQRIARQRLGTDAIHTLHNRASLWYEQHGLLSEAVESALQARNFERTALLIEQVFLPQNFRKAYLVLRRWLEQMPEVIFDTHPALSFAYAEVLLFTSRRRDLSIQPLYDRLLHIAEQAFRLNQDNSKLAQVFSLKATLALYRNELPTSFALAQQTLATQPEGEQHWRGSSLLLLGIEALLAGKLSHALQYMHEARIAYEADQSLPGLIARELVMGEIRAAQGTGREATQHYQRVIVRPDEEEEKLVQHQFTSKGGTREPLFARLALHGLALLAYERNELDKAEQLLDQAQALDDTQVEELHFQTSGSLLKARILHARGAFTQAQDLLNQFAVLAQAPQFLREVRFCQARMALAAGELASVEFWSQTPKQPDIFLPLVRQAEEALLLARLCIAQGKGEQALHILAPWHTETETQGCMRSLWEIQIVQALAHCAQDQQVEAKQLVKQVLVQTQAEGYQRIFLDEGPAMEALLKLLLSEIRETPLASHVRVILHAFAREHNALHTQDAPSSVADSPLFEPLSPQEQRVLRLLVAGRTYTEMAQELIVSLNTIKTQVSSIYRKLGVNRRAEVVALARRLNLL